jgi:chemosensory pili system protein ChpA (sensor histidine kinase/response regulator)
LHIEQLILKANAFAEGDPNAAILTAPPPAAEPPRDEPALEMDPVLLDIFAKETAGHLRVITEYLAGCDGHAPPFDVTDKLHRACHTLHGSANMANVERGVAVTGALNRFVRRVYEYQVGFERSGLDGLRAGARAIAAIVADINKPNGRRADYTLLIEHLTKLSNAVRTPEPDEAEIEAPAPPIAPTPAAKAKAPPPSAAEPEPEEADYDE